MFRPKLADDRGMLLIFTEERLPNIWMMNTLVALDIVYLDSKGNVVDVITDAQPCPGEPCPRFTPKLPAKAVLEIPAGSATLHGVSEVNDSNSPRPGFLRERLTRISCRPVLCSNRCSGREIRLFPSPSLAFELAVSVVPRLRPLP